MVAMKPTDKVPFAVLEFHSGERLTFRTVEDLAAFCCERVADMMHMQTEEIKAAAGLTHEGD